MARTTRADLAQMVTILNRTLTHEYRLDHAYGGVRLAQIIDDTTGAERNVSPRLTTGEMKLFLSGMLAGVDARDTEDR